MYIEGSNGSVGCFVNLKDVMTITIDSKNPRVVTFTYLNNGGTVNIFNESEEIAKKNLKYFSDKASIVQGDSILSRF